MCRCVSQRTRPLDHGGDPNPNFTSAVLFKYIQPLVDMWAWRCVGPPPSQYSQYSQYSPINHTNIHNNTHSSVVYSFHLTCGSLQCNAHHTAQHHRTDDAVLYWRPATFFRPSKACAPNREDPPPLDLCSFSSYPDGPSPPGRPWVSYDPSSKRLDLG